MLTRCVLLGQSQIFLSSLVWGNCRLVHDIHVPHEYTVHCLGIKIRANGQGSWKKNNLI